MCVLCTKCQRLTRVMKQMRSCTAWSTRYLRVVSYEQMQNVSRKVRKPLGASAYHRIQLHEYVGKVLRSTNKYVGHCTLGWAAFIRTIMGHENKQGHALPPVGMHGRRRAVQGWISKLIFTWDCNFYAVGTRLICDSMKVWSLKHDWKDVRWISNGC